METAFSALLVGEESLLVQCGERLLERKHTIAGVVTRHPQIKAWAEERGVPVVAPGKGLEERLDDVAFDWLLSIANLAVIPDAVLARANRGAVNFHDGPLPAFAGLYVTSWALLEGATEHGVSWHLIEGGIDEGDLLASARFDLAPDETAFTLNARCFGAAIDSFGELIEELESGCAGRRAQDLSERSYYARHRRPASLGVIDWTRDADEIERLVRALDFGTYENPLVLPKLMLEGRVVHPVRVELSSSVDGAEPGEILEVAADGVRVATAEGALWLRRVLCASGLELSPESWAKVGQRLPALSEAEAAAIDARWEAVSKHEAFWRRRLGSLVGPSVPGLEGQADAPFDAATVEVELPAALDESARLAAVGAWLARISESERVDFGWVAPKLEGPPAGIFAELLPLRFVGAESSPFSEVAEAFAAELEKAERRGGYARDLPLRSAPSSVPRWDVILGASPLASFPEEAAPLAISVEPGASSIRVRHDRARLDDAAMAALALSLDSFLRSAAASPAAPLAQLALVDEPTRKRLLVEMNRTEVDYPREACVHQLFERQVERSPDAIALCFEGEELSYAELNARANRVGHHLRSRGVGRDAIVGLYVHRSLDLLVGALGILKAGGAYLPLDPDYPAERVALMLEDSGAKILLTQSGLRDSIDAGMADVVEVDSEAGISASSSENVDGDGSAESLAYVIYTSGSTGRPKGVMVEHRNASNFFVGMDERITHEPPGVWLAVTSLSFDISVLELFWTIARGFTVVLHRDRERRAFGDAVDPAIAQKPMDFSLFYWGNDDGPGRRKYKLLLEGAKFADANGFNAVWTPERHFHAFGGPYPNPAVTGAAVAAVTSRIQVRAGSCVLPLHHPVRVAEEWAVLDNLSDGRVGIGIAAGWQPDDFVLRPENTPPENKPAMFRDLEKVRALWRGDAVPFERADGKVCDIITQPRPVQAELPVWITTAGNPETYRQAAEIGANVLTHLLGQSIEEVGEKIRIYRDALVANGRDPAEFKVALMLHTYVGEDRDTVRELAREPMKGYLRSAAGLIKEYAWAFPAFKKPEGVEHPANIDLGTLSEEELDAILEFAFARYFDESGLFGTVEDCDARVNQLKAIGVDEIACLIDYGVSPEEVLEGLVPLAEVRAHANRPAELPAEGERPQVDYSIAAQVARHGVTHLQCTPSMARMFLHDVETASALGGLKHLMIGGEALPGALVSELRERTSASIENMYGPTETTIWSSTATATDAAAIVPLGKPIANTQLYILDASMRVLPVGFPGELYIGGEGVTRGYLHRPELTAERFVPDPFRGGEARMYRTGDRVRYREGGALEFLGRADHQVKLRGYRIELGEIEADLEEMPAVRQAVVLAREDNPGDLRLVAYTTLAEEVGEEAMREHLAAKLPSYMVPAHFVVLDSFPLTPNAKVDRKRLPAPDAAAGKRAEYRPPEEGAEAAIAEVWQRVLHVKKVGSSDNFFDLGGHSLLAVQAHRELRDLVAPQLAITDIFRFPTVKALAAYLADGGEDAEKAIKAGSDRGAARRAALGKRGAARRRRTRS